MSQGSQVGVAAPGHSRVDLGGASVGQEIDLTVYSSDCRKVGGVTLSSEQPEAYVDPTGTISALRSDEADQVNSRVSYASTEYGFNCAKGGWQIVVRNDLATEVYLEMTDVRRDRWSRIGAGGRARSIVSDSDPFPEGLSVSAYSVDCRLLGTVHPTIDLNVVYLDGAGTVSLRTMSDFWQGLTRNNLTGLNGPPSPPCSGASPTTG